MKIFTGSCKSCGDILAASTDSRDVGEWVKSGLAVAYVDGPVSIGGHAGCSPAAILEYDEGHDDDSEDWMLPNELMKD